MNAETRAWRSRVRIAHSKTQRAGWQHETSVEIEWEAADALAEFNFRARLAELLEAADAAARVESARRAALDGEAAA